MSDSGETSTPEPFKRVTIVDVARVAGVSTATVSKVINDRYGVAPATSARVREVIEELGYVSSLGARSLRSSRTGVLGILVPDFDPFSTEVLKGVSDAGRPAGYELMAYALNRGVRETGWELRSLSQLQGTLIDGAVVCTPTTLRVSRGTAVVVLDPHVGPITMPAVDADNLAGGLAATEHLIRLGHRRIAYLGGRCDLASALHREQGYRQAMTNHGLAVDERLVREGDYTAGPAEAAAAEMVTMDDPPTAFFAANDISALGVLRVLDEAGYRVPEEFSVVGFDNLPESRECEPALTTVEQPLREMGAAAVSMLIDLLDGKDVSAHRRLPVHLVVRDSCSAPRPARPLTVNRK